MLEKLRIGCAVLVINIDFGHDTKRTCLAGGIECLRPDAVTVPIFDDACEFIFTFSGNLFGHTCGDLQDFLVLPHEKEEERCAVPAAANVIIIIAAVVPTLAVEDLFDAFLGDGAY